MVVRAARATALAQDVAAPAAAGAAAAKPRATKSSVSLSVWRWNMATNLAIDDALIVEAQAIGGAATKKAAVTEALKEYIQRRKQVQILSLFGKVEYDPEYDYKRIRARW